MRDQLVHRTAKSPSRPDASAHCCDGGALWGWSPPPLPADTVPKRAVDRVLPRAGWPVVAYFVAVFVMVSLASHVPNRAGLALVGVAGFAGGGWCAANFWRCRHAHCLITSTGWLALSGLAFVETVIGHSVIGNTEQIVFVGVLAVGIAFEILWRLVHGTNAVTARRPGLR